MILAQGDIEFIYLLLGGAAPALILSTILCAIMRKLSPKLGYVDHPGKRKNHAKPMPMGGGVAIVATMILMVGGGLLMVSSGVLEKIPQFGWLADHKPGVSLRTQQAVGVLFCALILHVMGLFDDVKNLGPRFKLIIQLAVATLAVVGFGVRAHVFVPVPALSAIITILWITVITNAFNFLDNADGLSAGVALICTGVLAAVAIGSGQIFVGVYLACLAGAILGFLLHNFPPARLFLGDAGSLPMGFLLATGSILTTYYQEQSLNQARTAVLIPLVVMAIPLYDFISVVVIRTLQGKSPFLGDHQHFSHRLIRRGLSVRHAVLTIYLACLGTAVAAILLQHVKPIFAALLFMQTICIVVIIAILEYQPARHDHES